MATRCPSSTFYGRAILPDYQWQINQRGVANIIPCAGSSVHGLIYRLDGTSDDEARLDRSEGVGAGYYTKKYLSMVVYRASEGKRLQMRRIVEELGGAEGMRSMERGKERAGRMESGVLVYASEGYVQRGEPREEYVGRMNLGIRDGVAMGIPRAYFENAVRGFIPDRSPPARSEVRNARPGRQMTMSRVRSMAEVREIGRWGTEGYADRSAYGCGGSTRDRSRGVRVRREGTVEDEFRGRPNSWTGREYDYYSYCAGTLTGRTVTPDVNCYYMRRSR